MAITKSSFDPQSATTPDSVLPAEEETSDFKQDMDLFAANTALMMVFASFKSHSMHSTDLK